MDEPMTVMAQAAAELHEMFTSFMRAGFSRKEALYLAGQYLTAQIQSQHPPEEAS